MLKDNCEGAGLIFQILYLSAFYCFEDLSQIYLSIYFISSKPATFKSASPNHCLTSSLQNNLYNKRWIFELCFVNFK
jgi:hypothetical protein